MSFKPSEEITRQFKSKMWIGRLFGVCNLEGGNELQPRLAIVILLGAIEQVMHFHGLRQSWPDFALICNSLAVLCIVLQLLVRLGSKFINRDNDNMLELLKTLTTFFEREEQHAAYRPVLEANLKVSDFLLNGYLILCFAIFCIPNPTAWIVSWYTGELIIFTPIYLPIAEPTTLTGYVISSTLLLFYTLLVYIILMTSDVIFMYFAYQCIPMIDIYCMKLQEFGEKLTKVKTQKVAIQPVQPSTSRSAQIQQKQADQERLKEIENVERQLIDLIKEFHSYNDYVRSTVQFIAFTTFTAMSLNSMAIAMSTVVILYYSKAIGGVVLVLLFFQVLTPCLQGTMILRQKEKLLAELFAFPWYKLSLSKQKLFLQLIHLCQNSSEFRIPIIGTLNMQLFTSVMNGSYSYLMYLLNLTKV